MRQHMMLLTEQVGNLGTNCYLLCNKDTKEAVVIDPGAEGYLIRDVLENNGMRPVAILLTHGHYDHIDGVAALKESFHSLKTYACYEERETLQSAEQNLSETFGRPCTVNADEFLHDGDKLEFAGAHFRCIYTPGHTPGGMSFYAIEDEVLFSGDTLFAGSVGRTDFPGGDAKALLHSIRVKYADIGDYVKVCPGHGPTTTMEIERAENPYM
ncbi:MAG: MBL fold metallo-hydrolase [Lachnospiraceae bacterium]|nr:MBL fold metallo-hydrolase [Lachnospiraceae bacterium]